MGKNQMTISEKWNSKFNKISVNESLQSRLKKDSKKTLWPKNAVEIKRRNSYGR